jgi:hypothetical protein
VRLVSAKHRRSQQGGDAIARLTSEARARRFGNACANRPVPGAVCWHEKDRRANADLSLSLVR